MRVHIGVQQSTDHSLVLRVSLHCFRLEELHALPAQGDGDLHILFTERQLLRRRQKVTNHLGVDPSGSFVYLIWRNRHTNVRSTESRSLRRSFLCSSAVNDSAGELECRPALGVEQARSRSPRSVQTQQSWHAPIRQKPARGPSPNSLSRTRRTFVSSATSSVSPASACTLLGRRCASALHAVDGARAGSARPAVRDGRSRADVRRAFSAARETVSRSDSAS